MPNEIAKPAGFRPVKAQTTTASPIPMHKAGQSKPNTDARPNSLLKSSGTPLTSEKPVNCNSMLEEASVDGRRSGVSHAERRGFEPGHEVEDWLRVEKEIDAALCAPPVSGEGLEDRMDPAVDRQSIPADTQDVPVGGPRSRQPVGRGLWAWRSQGSLSSPALHGCAGGYSRSDLLPPQTQDVFRHGLTCSSVSPTHGRDWRHPRSASAGGSTGKPDIGSIQTR